MLLLMCYDYDQYNIILIISFAITIHQLVAKLISAAGHTNIAASAENKSLELGYFLLISMCNKS